MHTLRYTHSNSDRCKKKKKKCQKAENALFRYLVIPPPPPPRKIPIIKTLPFRASHLASHLPHQSGSRTNWSCWCPSSHTGVGRQTTVVHSSTHQGSWAARFIKAYITSSKLQSRSKRHSCERRLGPTNQVRPQRPARFSGSG